MTLNRLVDSGQPITPPPDVQRTSLGLDALGRFVCNTWDEATANSTRPFDAIVIGGGMFGGYCAEKIYRLGAANGLTSQSGRLKSEVDQFLGSLRVAS